MDSTVDNFEGLQQAFNDAAFGARFGLTGHFAQDYCSNPLCIYDFTRLEHIGNDGSRLRLRPTRSWGCEEESPISSS